MIKPKRIRKKRQLIDAIYIDYKQLTALASNSCVGVNESYFFNLVCRANLKNIIDKHFWKIINKYENYERELLYSNNGYSKVRNYRLMSLRDIFYLIHIIDYKPFSITTFIKTNVTEGELEENIFQVCNKHEKNNQPKQKLKTPSM